ncbi:MAG TPA: hybrid sensor histidine kinase/response regulator, partial [Caulobacteraceae bacterium]
MSGLKSLSLAHKLLIGVLAVSFLAMGLSFVFSFDAFRERFETQKIADLQLYAQERTRTEQSLFNDLRGKHVAANAALLGRLSTIRQPAVDAEFARLFPVRADGTRRSPANMFDGVSDGKGGYVHGFGAFMANGAAMTASDRALMMAAARVVYASGQADIEKFDNFYFFTPDDRMVIFAPRRPDRLMYYRQNAPASFSFRGEDMVRLMTPATNPQRLFRCDKLRA